jgi:hypothetical protein
LKKIGFAKGANPKLSGMVFSYPKLITDSEGGRREF